MYPYEVSMKRILTAGALLLLCLALAACSAAAPEPEPERAAETPAPAVSDSALRISELMASNKASVPLGGRFPDWVELYNPGEKTETLDGKLLRCGKKSMTLSGELEPGSRVLIPCEGMSLPKEGAELRLLDWNGAPIDSVVYENAPADRSLVRNDDGSLAVCRWPSPGQENSAAGYAAFQETLTGGELVIWEVMVYNDRFPDGEGGFHDWVELKNVSDRALVLRDYHLAEKTSEWGLWPLPELTLEPGASAVLYSDTPDGLPFRLSSREETLLLYRDDGTLCDAVCLHDVPVGGSMGRLDGRGGFFYFTEPSPGADNAASGLRRVAAQPVSDKPGGVYDDVKDVTVTLSGEGEIRYTLDGSLPTEEAELYTGPLRLEKTAVLRAACFAPDALPSRPLDLSYILNEKHSIPVVSVVADPEGLFSSKSGIYSNPKQDWEIPASVVLFADERGFAPIECGLKIHGNASRAQDKKSFKVCFRGHYGGKLVCDLFENGITEFDSILLRAAQESDISTQMRDVLMHELAMQCSPSLPTQAHRYCALYLNGEYWGLYALREAHSPEHYARHYGYDPASVVMSQGTFPPGEETGELESALFHVKDPEVYARVRELLDVENVITWSVIESFCGNMDIFPPNVRFYRSGEDGVLRYALVDLDLGLFAFGDAHISMSTGYSYSNAVWELMKNPDFRALYLQRLSEYLHGPLSDENYLETARRLADEISAEAGRDYVRWGNQASSWEKQVETYIYSFANSSGGHAFAFAASARGILKITPEEWDALFADLGPVKSK